MSDTVKNVFKILIKVPIVIVVFYMIFNLFSFTVCYVKMLGLSYVAMQVAIENNYIPENERVILEKYMKNNIETEVLKDVSFTPDTKFTKGQYGEPVKVGVQARYVFIWPLITSEQIEGSFIGGQEVQFSGRYKSASELEALRKRKEESGKTNIVIEYEVPGLRYYPDLE